MRHITLIASLILAACGPTHGTEVNVPADGPAWTREPDVFAQVERVAGAAAVFWGGSPDMLIGWAITFTNERMACGSSSWAWGCTEYHDRTIEVALMDSPCPAGTVLAHEIGHVVVPNDAGHQDPRWRDQKFWYDMADMLKADEPDPACRAAISDAVTKMIVFY